MVQVVADTSKDPVIMLLLISTFDLKGSLRASRLKITCKCVYKTKSFKIAWKCLKSKIPCFMRRLPKLRNIVKLRHR